MSTPCATLDLEVPLDSSQEARFAAFVAAHRDRAVRIAWRLTGEDQAVAEEVAQDAFVRALRALPRFRDEASLATWFHRILVRQALNRRRWRGLRQRWGGLWGDASPLDERTDSAPRPVGDAALRARIAVAMDHLSPGQRAVFTLVHLEGFTVAEAAALVGCAEGTAKSHLHRALASLRAELSQAREEYGT
ncbi:MAG: RNA polymerase sigma factor [Pseudomonadota bacterium]